MRVHKMVIVLLALALAGSISVALAQSDAGPATGVLARATVDSLPTPNAEVWFMRLTFEPGGSLPPDEQIGPTFVYVESGAVTLTADRVLTVFDGTTPATPEPIEEKALLESGGSALVSDGSTLAVRNDGSEPAAVLALLIIDPGREGLTGGEEEEPVKVTFQPISIGHGSFAEGPATLTIERIVVGPGETAEAGAAGGADVGAVEAGQLQLTLASGDGWVWPAVAASATGDDEAESPERTDLTVGSALDLNSGDGYALTDAVAEWHACSESNAVVLRVVVEPLERS